MLSYPILSSKLRFCFLPSLVPDFRSLRVFVRDVSYRILRDPQVLTYNSFAHNVVTQRLRNGCRWLCFVLARSAAVALSLFRVTSSRKLESKSKFYPVSSPECILELSRYSQYLLSVCCPVQLLSGTCTCTYVS